MINSNGGITIEKCPTSYQTYENMEKLAGGNFTSCARVTHFSDDSNTRKVTGRQKKILVVDDSEHTRQLILTMLKTLGYQTEEAADGYVCLDKLEQGGIDLVLMDVNMPGINGFDTVHRIRQDAKFNDLPIIMVTGHDTREDRIKAVQVGANDFISKPVNTTELEVRTTNTLKMKDALDALKAHGEELEKKVHLRTQSLLKAMDELTVANKRTEDAEKDTIHRLAVASDYKDEDTGGHIKRIGSYCAILAKHAGLSKEKVDIIKHASTLHDIGKIGIPDNILLKPGKLTSEEFNEIKKHTLFGGEILKGSQSKYLKAGEIIAMTHHERWDGAGYPNGLKEEEIPIEGRICAIADVFDALTTRRPYKKAFSNEKAFKIMKDGRGNHFDPDLIDIFFDKIDEITAAQAKYR